MVDEHHAGHGLVMVTRTCHPGRWYLVGNLFKESSMPWEKPPSCHACCQVASAREIQCSAERFSAVFVSLVPCANKNGHRSYQKRAARGLLIRVEKLMTLKAILGGNSHLPGNYRTCARGTVAGFRSLMCLNEAL